MVAITENHHFLTVTGTIIIIINNDKNNDKGPPLPNKSTTYTLQSFRY